MNLLPTLDELVPIVNDKNTFYDCGFNSSFSGLSFEKKLQVLCDIVRQSIYPNIFPNPDIDIKEMNGNCYTASMVFKQYLEKLKIGNNIRCVLARKRVFDPDDCTTIHFVVLVDSENKHTYQVDITPFCGYKYGYVEDITYKKIYEEYQVVNSTIENYLYIFRKIIYDDSTNNFDISKIDYYIDILNECSKYNILNGYVSKAMMVIMKYISCQHDVDVMIHRINALNPYNKYNIEKLKYKKSLLIFQANLWLNELNELKKSNHNIKRQSELAISIVQELKMIDESYERFADINGRKVRLSFINPRFLYENGLNTVMIKPSAYFISKEMTIKNGYIASFHNPIGEYLVDLSKPTQQLSIKPMLFSHPCGEEYIRTMIGNSNVMLFNGDANKINELKKYYRQSLCEDMWYKEIKWIDDQNITWHPFYTNLVHGADNYSESSLHYLIGYPEHQPMTRFMYPNPKLIKEIKK